MAMEILFAIAQFCQGDFIEFIPLQFVDKHSILEISVSFGFEFSEC